MASYLTSQNLSDAWGPEAMRQLFDDANTNTLNATAIALVITRASARTTAWMPDTYTGTLPFPSPIPELIQECAFEYASYFAYPRNPDYFRALGLDQDKLLKRADGLGRMIQSSILRLIDAQVTVPENVGGDVEQEPINGQVRQEPFFFLRGLGDF